MYGLGGQLCIACPEQDVLLTTVADTRLDSCGVQKIYDAFFEEILPYADTEDMVPEMFSLKVRTLEDNPVYRRQSAGPYEFSMENPLQLRHLTLKDGTLVLEQHETTVIIPFLPGDVMETCWPGAPKVPALVTAGWTAPGELRLRCHAIGDAPCGFEMLLYLSKGMVTIQCCRSWDPLTDLYEGVASGTACCGTEEG